MYRRAVVTVGVLILLFAVSGQAGASARAAGAMNGSAQQGQRYIDAGEYDRAVREFTCLIDARPAR
jgi:hypothetical protein